MHVLAVVMRWFLMLFAMMNYPQKRTRENKQAMKNSPPQTPKRVAPLAPLPVPTKVARVLPLRRVAKKNTAPQRM